SQAAQTNQRRLRSCQNNSPAEGLEQGCSETKENLHDTSNVELWCANPRSNERFLQPKTLCDLSRGTDLWSLELRAILHGNRAGFAASRHPAAVPVFPGAPANRAPGGALSSPG